LVRNRKAGFTHDCCGYSSEGLPSIGCVWQSVEYRETVYEVGGLEILDVRGRSSSGNMWHFLDRLGEYAGYLDSRAFKANDAALLDKVLDGVCIRKQAR